ncbi:hypothetical protein F5Y03DRAFT_376575 [Xylaria venustula]|nr:hypothetical protein F5Y03DRAFT_376575 [Xylaria venustula]
MDARTSSDISSIGSTDSSLARSRVRAVIRAAKFAAAAAAAATNTNTNTIAPSPSSGSTPSSQEEQRKEKKKKKKKKEKKQQQKPKRDRLDRGELRDQPCLGCLNSALAGNKDCGCYYAVKDGVPRGNRCWRCASGHSCILL